MTEAEREDIAAKAAGLLNAVMATTSREALLDARISAAIALTYHVIKDHAETRCAEVDAEYAVIAAIATMERFEGVSRENARVHLMAPFDRAWTANEAAQTSEALRA